MSAIVPPTKPLFPPTRKPYTPEKPKRAKAMTIAVGFLCDNGEHLLLAADRQITSRGAYKIRRQKYAQSQQGFFDMAFVYSGEPGTFSAFVHKLESLLDPDREITSKAITDTIETVLEGMKLTDPLYDPRFWLLVGINELFEKPQLIVFDGRYVFPASSDVQIIGFGDTSLINFLSDKLHAPDLTKNEGIALAAYLVRKAVQYVDTVGEPIDVICGSSSGFEIVSEDKIKAGIQAIENQEEHLSTWLVRTPFQL
jgi:20S proteasome alpha/beta subunit